MERIQLIALILGGLMVALSACGDSTASAVPKVSSTYQTKLQNAWDVAGEGKSPTMACASVIGTAVGMNKAGQGNKTEAIQAYEACYVDSYVRYANIFIAQPDQAAPGNGKEPKGCMALFIQSRIHQSSLGGFAADFGLDRAVMDEKIRAALSQGAAAPCNDLFTAD